MAIDLNRLAVRIAEVESGAQEVNIAQIKEILRITLDLLRKESIEDILEVIARHD